MISIYILETRCLRTRASGQIAVALNRPLGPPAFRQAVDWVQAGGKRVLHVWEAYEVSSPGEAPRELATLASVARTCGFAHRTLVRAGYLDFASTIRIPAWSVPP